MILLFLALAGLPFVSSTRAIGLTEDIFEKTIEPMCFQEVKEGEAMRFYGQEHPLSHTLENFIALLEELEVANPSILIGDELYFLIKNYIYENFKFTEVGTIDTWSPQSANMDLVNKLWEKNERHKNQLVTIPYSQGENCSLFNMLSHSIILEARPPLVFRSATNTSRLSLSENTLYPMEVGVVSIRGTTEAVALGKVLMGMYLGSHQQREKDDITKIKNIEGDVPEFLTNNIVDPLFSLTMAEVISLTKWFPEIGKRDGLGKNGFWKSILDDPNFDTKDICPIVYKLADDTRSSQSYSTLRGAADGLILGSIMKSILESKSDVKLSEVLRMYYSRGGIAGTVDQSILGQTGQIWASFCNREQLIELFKGAIQEQVMLYVMMISGGTRQVKAITDAAMNYFDQEKQELFRQSNTIFRGYCHADISTDKVESLPLESPLDITAVLDTDHGLDNFKKQQLILGYFVKELELRYYGSRLTVLTDQKSTSAVSASGIMTLTPIVENTYSSACAACIVSQIVKEDKAAAPESEVIMAIDQLLQAKKDNDTNYNGVKGKVIIYFNFKEEETTSIRDREEAKIDGALRDLNLHHRDVAKYALGRSKELVKRYAKNDISFAIDVDNPEQAGKELFERVSKGAAKLQYSDCEKATRESAAFYENFVSRNAVQHWRMPAEYFYKSRIWKFLFESSFGSIRVCHYQGTSKSPENQATNCKEGNKVEFKDSNPCKGLNQDSCSPFNFAVIGLNSTEDTNNNVCKDTSMDAKCRTMDQIKFRITHEGIRCSGTVGIITSPILIILGVFLLHMLQKRQ